MKRTAALVIVLGALASSAMADLTNPSTLIIKETSPSHFTVELTLPVINGRVVKAKPIIPSFCVVEGDPEIGGDALKAVRTWSMSCDTSQMAGAPIGIQGLLGTQLDVLLTIEMLNDRQHTQQLRATQAYFVIPPPPTLTELTLDAGRQGAERLVRRPELALLLLIMFLAPGRRKPLAIALVSFAVAQGLGQWLAGQRLVAMSIFLPQVAAAALAWLSSVELMGRPVLRPGWLRPMAAPMSMLGLLYGAAQPETVPAMGLSKAEQGLWMVLSTVGALVALLVLTQAAQQLRLALLGLSDTTRKRWTHRIAYVTAVLTGGVFFYRVSAPWFGSGVTPTVPLTTLVTAAALGIWCHRDFRQNGFVLAIVACAFCAAGLGVSFFSTLPLATVAPFGLLALVGTRLLLTRRWPLWLALPVVAVTALYQGYHAGEIQRHAATLPVANAIGLGALLAAVFLMSFRAVPAEERSGQFSPKVPGILVILVALLWQLADYREWVGGPVATDLAMGLARVPVLALVLLLAAWLAWPRRRRFTSRGEPSTNGSHWVLLGLAFFVFPLGTLRVDIPFHSPGAPNAAEASRVMNTLLTDTYLAFNLADEDDAFDRLALNLSQDLVADVYLDSRRRLTAGTREGAEVTVQDVSVTEVDDAISTVGNAFTYPCRWVVTARVRHLQHIHNRQNVYVGELTIQVEDDSWKIARLDLLSEERVVLSWTQS
ncbi:MAG: hypothetical protein GY906_30435 [bacterium]|nr:hypothetical protein [bacterium]